MSVSLKADITDRQGRTKTYFLRRDDHKVRVTKLDGSGYDLSYDPELGWTCECLGYKNFRSCKHCRAVQELCDVLVNAVVRKG